MDTKSIIEAWKNPNSRNEELSTMPNPVENNLDLSVIKGGDSDGLIHTVSGECNEVGHVHDCQTAEGFLKWGEDLVLSLVGIFC